MLKNFNKYLFINFTKYFFLLSILSILNAKASQVLNFYLSEQNVFLISVDPQTHIDYGLSYPVTYVFSIPSGVNNFRSHVKFKQNNDWSQLLEKTSTDFFNGEEVVRFDYTSGKAYVSVAFSEISDSIYIKIDNTFGENIVFSYDGMSKYYDNRDAVVTSTADDWASYFNDKFLRTCRNFRNFNLWVSCAVVTDHCDQNTWQDIQGQLDSGYVEVVSHSQIHPYVPYEDIEGEVLGSKQDLIDNLIFPDYNKFGDHEYVYAWIAPYGQYDAAIDSMVSVGRYLTSRLYDAGGNYQISDWDQDLYKYDPVEVTTEIGPLWLGSTDTMYLNNSFDYALENEGIYHVMCHPNVIEWEEEYPWVHLEYISNRNNIWYVAFGHLYLYDFISSTYPTLDIGNSLEDDLVPKRIILSQNFPNPFNSRTALNFRIYYNSYVKLNIYNYNGIYIKSIIDNYMVPGDYSMEWDGTNLFGKKVASGVYLYLIDDGTVRTAKKMILTK